MEELDVTSKYISLCNKKWLERNKMQNEKIRELLLERGINPDWIVVDGHCACLVKIGGEAFPVGIDEHETKVIQARDRVAFIEKTPRIRTEEFTNYWDDSNKWVSGPKGRGGNIEEDGETIYGFFGPSRTWCELELIEKYPKLTSAKATA